MMKKQLLLLLVLCLGQAKIMAQDTSGEAPQEIDFEFVNETTGEMIEGVDILIKSRTNIHFRKEGKSNTEGKFHVSLPAHEVYLVKVKHPSYFVHARVEYDIKEPSMYPKKAQIELREIVSGVAMQWEGIRFMPNSSQLPEQTPDELYELSRFLTDNPNICVEISSHTDARGNANYNLELSQRRAEAITNYLMEKGIDSKRLVAKGYGETRLTNHCADNVRCTTKQHLQNRRIELMILEVYK